MERILQISRENSKTFYDNRTGARIGIWPRIFLTFVVSLVLACVFRGEVDTFVNAVITIQSILIGFSFSVMFFLISGEVGYSNASGSIELELQFEKLNKLSEEIFYNISYFNVVAIACLILCLIVLVPSPYHPVVYLVTNFGIWSQDQVALWCGVSLVIISHFIRLLLFFCLIESGYTFARAVGRVNYLFEEKMDLSKKTKPTNKIGGDSRED